MEIGDFIIVRLKKAENGFVIEEFNHSSPICDSDGDQVSPDNTLVSSTDKKGVMEVVEGIIFGQD